MWFNYARLIYAVEMQNTATRRFMQAVIIDCIQLLHSSSRYDDCY